MRSKIKIAGLALVVAFAASILCSTNYASATSFGHKNKSSYNYSQYDHSWHKKWNSGLYGCGMTSIAIAASYAYNKKITPTTVLMGAVNHGVVKNPNQGMGNDQFVRVAKLGLKVKSLGKTPNMNTIAKYVNDGWLVALHAHGSKPFSGDGHWLIVYGGTYKKKNGKITDKKFCVSDPGDKDFRGVCVDAKKLLSTMKSNIGVYALTRK